MSVRYDPESDRFEDFDDWKNFYQQQDTFAYLQIPAKLDRYVVDYFDDLTSINFFDVAGWIVYNFARDEDGLRVEYQKFGNDYGAAGWRETRTVINADGTRTFYCKTADDIDFVFCDTERFLISTEFGVGGTISPNSREVVAGTIANFELSTEPGYSITEVTGCGGSLIGSTYTTAPVFEACTITATFDDSERFPVTIVTNYGGVVAPNGQLVIAGESVSFTIVPNIGYEIASVQGCDGGLSGTIYQTGPVNSACQIDVLFQLTDNYFDVTTNVSVGGSITPNRIAVLDGDSTSFSVTADVGYQIAGVEGCGGTLSDGIYETAAIIAACEVTASFDRLSYQVTAVAGAGGTITPPEQSVFYGDVAVVEVQPEEGYRIEQVSGCGGSLNGGYYASAQVFSACEISVTFSEIPAIDTDSILTLTGQALDLDISHGFISIDGVSSTLYETAINSDGSFQIELQAESLVQSPNRLRVRLEGISSYGHEIELTTSLPSVQELWSQYGASVTTTELLELKVSTISTSLDAYAAAITGNNELTSIEYYQALASISSGSLFSHMNAAELVYMLGYQVLPQDKADLFQLLLDPITADRILVERGSATYNERNSRLFEEKLTHYRRGILAGEYYQYVRSFYPRTSDGYLQITPTELRYVSSADETRNNLTTRAYHYHWVDNAYQVKSIDYPTDSIIETSCSVPTVKLFDDPALLSRLPASLRVTCLVGVYEVAPVLGLKDTNLVTTSLYQFIQPQTVYVSEEAIDVPESIVFKHSLHAFQELPGDIAIGDETIAFDHGSLFLLPQLSLSPVSMQFLGRLEADGTVLRIIDAVDSLPYPEALLALVHNQATAEWTLEQDGRALRLTYMNGSQHALIQKLSLDDHEWQYLVTFTDESGQLMYRLILSLGVVSWQNLADLLVSYSEGDNYLKQKTLASFASNVAGWLAFKFSEVGAGTYVQYCDGTPASIDAVCRGIASIGINLAMTGVEFSEDLLTAIRRTAFVNYRSFRVLRAEGDALWVFQQYLYELNGVYMSNSVLQKLVILERVTGN